MKTWHTVASKVQPGIFLPVLGVCVVLYFAYHAVQGDRGIRAMLDYQYRIDKTKKELTQVKKERQRLEHRVSLLRSDNLDPDLLEERAHAVLSLVHPDEIAIIVRR